MTCKTSAVAVSRRSASSRSAVRSSRSAWHSASDVLDRRSAARDWPTCCRASRSFADLVGTDLPGRSYRDRPRLPQVADRDDHGSADELPLSGRPRRFRSFGERPVTARPAHCPEPPPRSLDRTDTGRPALVAGMGLHAPLRSLPDAAPRVSRDVVSGLLHQVPLVRHRRGPGHRTMR